MQKLPSDDLISACLEHRAGAWEEFLRRYGNLIYSSILKVGLFPSDQEEAFQNTIIACYRELPKLRDRGKLLSWIIGISRRQAINRIRARKREVLVEEVTDDMVVNDQGLGEPGVNDPAHGGRLLLEQGQQAKEALELLPERCRRLLQLLFVEDPPLDYTEVARRESIPIGSIGPTRQRCLEKARKIFRERGWS
ncbi:MAG: RNA polymerase sigma factor [Candidatus Eisenbacteria bacterium]|nr:RNA polymerase sigma factor [Candidatus Eisenbacteria bacterium]MCC7140861.1 RNA polymerase sigma factor [Candidatus Eisenbacteria bacterium]